MQIKVTNDAVPGDTVAVLATIRGIDATEQLALAARLQAAIVEALLNENLWFCERCGVFVNGTSKSPSGPADRCLCGPCFAAEGGGE